MIYGFWGASITFWGFITSCFNDALGVRRSLLFGFAVSFFANIVIATSTSIEMLLFILFAVLPVGNSIGIPMLTVGIKRYTTSQNRGFAYGLFYAVMNIAALVSGPVIDFFNVLICPSGSACSSDYYSTNSNSGTNSTFSRALDSFNSAQGSSVLVGESTSARRALSFFNIDLSPGSGYYQHPMRLYTGNRLVIWSIVVVYFFAWIVTFFYLREIKVTEEATIGSEGPNVTATDSDLSRTGRKRTDFDLEDVVGAASEEDITTPETLSRKALLSPSARQTLRATGRQQQVYSPLTQHQEGQNGSLHHRRSVGNRLSPSHSHSSHGNGPGSDEDKPVEVMLSPMQQRSGTGGPHSNRNNFRNSSLDRAGGPADQPSSSSRSTANSTTAPVIVAAGTAAVTTTTTSLTLEPAPNRCTVVKEILSSATFYRFCCLTLFCINLHTIFRHVDATLPTYLVRVFGPNYPKGMIYSINPFLIIWLTPTVAALTSHYPHYDMIKYGGYISAISPFFVVMSTTTWAVVMFMVLLSIGEAIWSPRLYDYTMSIAPEGREATFSALAALPLFAAKIPVGLLSGYLISKYLPENSDKKPDGQSLWLVIGLMTLLSPILITICEPCIREPDKKRKAQQDNKRDEDEDSEASSGDLEMVDNPMQHQQQRRAKSNRFTIADDEEDEEYGEDLARLDRIGTSSRDGEEGQDRVIV